MTRSAQLSLKTVYGLKLHLSMSYSKIVGKKSYVMLIVHGQIMFKSCPSIQANIFQILKCKTYIEATLEFLLLAFGKI